MIKLEGKNIRLRLVEEKDADFILALRLDNRYNTFLSPVSSDLEAQKSWIRNYKDDEKKEDYDKLINNKKFNGLIIFCAFLSSLVHFVTTRFLMPHAVEFFLCAVILYIFEKNKSKISKVEFLFLILSYLMLAITRPSTFIYTLVLIMIYRNKFDISKANLIIYIPISSMFSYLYIWISRTLYSQNYMFLNTYGSDMDSYRATLNIDQILNGLIKLPNLFVSPSMGILWSTPIVFFGILYMFFAKNKINIDYFLLLIFFDNLLEFRFLYRRNAPIFE